MNTDIMRLIGEDNDEFWIRLNSRTTKITIDGDTLEWFNPVTGYIITLSLENDINFMHIIDRNCYIQLLSIHPFRIIFYFQGINCNNEPLTEDLTTDLTEDLNKINGATPPKLWSSYNEDYRNWLHFKILAQQGVICTSDTPNEPKIEEYIIPSWNRLKIMYQGVDVLSPEATFALDTVYKVNVFHSMGVDVIHANQTTFCEWMLTNESISAALRANGQKVMVGIQETSGGALQYDVDEDATTLYFVSASKYKYSGFSDTKYADTDNKTLWLDDECMKFTTQSMSSSTIVWKGRNVYVHTFTGVTRGCAGTIATEHSEGSIPLNGEYLTTRLTALAEDTDLIFGYWCLDDPPVFPNVVVSNYGLSKNFHRIIRSVDADTNHLLCYGQMSYDPDIYTCLAGTTDFAYIDAICPYIYPWRYGTSYFDLWDIRYVQNRSYFAAAGKTPIIFPVLQADGGWIAMFDIPTKEQVEYELAYHVGQGANSVMFYNGTLTGGSNNMWTQPGIYDAIAEFVYP